MELPIALVSMLTLGGLSLIVPSLIERRHNGRRS
jgi:hypothetical protein